MRQDTELTLGQVQPAAMLRRVYQLELVQQRARLLRREALVQRRATGACFAAVSHTPDPLAWDYFFRQGHSCFVLVHLKDGKVIGGLYNGESFASSYPESQDIYLGEVWKVDEQGRFQSRIDATMGALVNHGVIDYLEFYAVGGPSNEASEEHTKAESR